MSETMRSQARGGAGGRSKGDPHHARRADFTKEFKTGTIRGLRR